LKTAEQPRPLCIAADERDREIALQCSTVETACRAIGWRPGDKIVRVAVLVARLVGTGELRATLDRIAGDRAVDCTPRHVARCLERLQELGVLTVSAESSPPWRRVGRPPVLYRVSVCWSFVRGLVADAKRWEDRMRAEVAAKDRPAAFEAGPLNNPEYLVGEYPTPTRRVPDACPTPTRRVPDACPTSVRHLEVTPTYTHLPINLLPPLPNARVETANNGAAAAVELKTDEWTEAAEAVRDAGVEGFARLVDIAKSHGYTAAELIDDAYVLRNCDKIKPGALFYRVTDPGRCWPASGVPEAATLRCERSKRADAVRSRTEAEAPANAKPGVVVAVTVKRLRAAGLDEFVTKQEAATFDRGEAAKTKATADDGYTNLKG